MSERNGVHKCNHIVKTQKYIVEDKKLQDDTHSMMSSI